MVLGLFLLGGLPFRVFATGFGDSEADMLKK